MPFGISTYGVYLAALHLTTWALRSAREVLLIMPPAKEAQLASTEEGFLECDPSPVELSPPSGPPSSIFDFLSEICEDGAVIYLFIY